MTATTGEQLVVRQPPDLEALRVRLQRVLDAGIKSLAVVLKHAAIYPEHERLVGALATEMGFTQARVALSFCLFNSIQPKRLPASISLLCHLI